MKRCFSSKSSGRDYGGLILVPLNLKIHELYNSSLWSGDIFDYLTGAVGNFRMKLGLSNEKKVVYCDSGAMIFKSCIQSG